MYSSGTQSHFEMSLHDTFTGQSESDFLAFASGFGSGYYPDTSLWIWTQHVDANLSRVYPVFYSSLNKYRYAKGRILATNSSDINGQSLIYFLGSNNIYGVADILGTNSEYVLGCSFIGDRRIRYISGVASISIPESTGNEYLYGISRIDLFDFDAYQASYFTETQESIIDMAYAGSNRNSLYFISGNSINKYTGLDTEVKTHTTYSTANNKYYVGTTSGKILEIDSITKALEDTFTLTGYTGLVYPIAEISGYLYVVMRGSYPHWMTLHKIDIATKTQEVLVDYNRISYSPFYAPDIQRIVFTFCASPNTVGYYDIVSSGFDADGYSPTGCACYLHVFRDEAKQKYWFYKNALLELYDITGFTLGSPDEIISGINGVAYGGTNSFYDSGANVFINANHTVWEGGMYVDDDVSGFSFRVLDLATSGISKYYYSELGIESGMEDLLWMVPYTGNTYLVRFTSYAGNVFTTRIIDKSALGL